MRLVRGSAVCLAVIVLAGCGGGSTKGGGSLGTASGSGPAGSGGATARGSTIAVMGEGPLAWAALRLFAASRVRSSPQVQPAPPPVPAPGDTGYYGCTKLSADDVAAAVGQRARGPHPNGGKPASGTQPAFSNCIYNTDTTDPAATYEVQLTDGSYPSPDAATQALYNYYGDTPAANIAGVGEGAFIFSNGSPAYVAVGADVVQLDLIAPQGTDRAGLYTTLLRDIAGHANNPAPVPTAPVPGPNDLDPCLLTPAEAQAIFQSGPVTVQRVFADNVNDFGCSYILDPRFQYGIEIDTVSNAALAASPSALQDRYTSDRQSFQDVTDIAGFPLPSANPTAGFADLWGFGNNSYVEIADHGEPQGAGGSASAPTHPIPGTPLVDFTNPIPDVAYLASVIPTPGLMESSICGTTGVRCATDPHFSVTGQGEGLNQ